MNPYRRREREGRRQLAVLRVIEACPWIGSKELSLRTGIGVWGVQRIVRALRADGTLERVTFWTGRYGYVSVYVLRKGGAPRVAGAAPLEQHAGDAGDSTSTPARGGNGPGEKPVLDS